MKIGQPASSIEVWDAGTYPAKVVGVEETESSFPGSEGKPRLKWRFMLRNDEGETSEVWYWTNATLSTHKMATLRPLVRALFPDAELDSPDYVFDTDEAVDKRCRVILGVDEERGRNRIEKVLAAEARRVAKSSPTPEAVGAGAPPF